SLENGHQSLIVINVGFSNARSIQTRYGFEAFDEILKEFRKRLGMNDSNYFITGRPSSNDLVLLLWGEDADSKLHNLLDKIT
ncbi:hypothetical protein OFO11_38960, partial [Escherichia coli]|nr:hypothetical protein [Escherichia coli]